MKKGLTLTLMTVAVAMLGLQSWAMAPVIGDIPSPIVGDENSVTNPNLFVFPDAIDLRQYVTDDTVQDPANIKWSYYIASPKYMINGVAPINLGTESPVTPGAKQINNQVLGGEVNPDGTAQTITVRNSSLSPIGGSNTDPGGSGIIAAQTQTCTLFASDGTTYSSKNIFLYTDNGGNDRLSKGGFVPLKDYTFTNTRHGFTYSYNAGTVTSGTNNNTAVCLGVPLTGINFAAWVGPLTGEAGELTLTANTVYKLRAFVNGSQTTVNTVPFWDLIIDNGDGNQATGTGRNLFGADSYFLDNQGGANAALQVAGEGTEYDLVWTPAAVSTTKWNSQIINGTDAEARKFRLTFRVLDVNNNAAITADSDLGTLCLNDFKIEKAPLSAMQLQGTAWSTTMSASTVYVESFQNPTVAYASGALTLTPSTAGRASELITVAPGDSNNNPGTPSSQTDNYPVALTANSIYYVSMDLSAPTQADIDNSTDVFWLSVDTPTNEVIQESFIVNNMNRAGMPDLTTQTFKFFYHSNKGTNSTVSQWKFLRPKFFFGNNGNLQSGTNAGGLRIHNMKVQKCTF